MKLQDCDCGGIPQVTYKLNSHNDDYAVGCTVCDNRTPVCESIREAAELWNETYCCDFPPAYQMESV